MNAPVLKFSRQINVPFLIELDVEITDAGVIEHIDGGYEESLPLADALRLERAVQFVTRTIQALATRGDLIEDALTRLPNIADFEIERAILGALVDLQNTVLGNFIGIRGVA